MSYLYWNCQGLGTPLTIHVLGDVIRRHRPKVVFLSETKSTSSFVKKLMRKWNLFGISVDRVGLSGGLALLWQKDVKVELCNFSSNHIDAVVHDGPGSRAWRFTGIYGFPEQQRRNETWSLLRQLNAQSNLPWVIGGDFNEILFNSEKVGGLVRSPSSIEAFRAVLAECTLVDLGYVGSHFTWSNHRDEPFTV
ncbi:hypothetical protein ABFS83_04G152200 [Erythranthe nasuta]